MKTKKFLETLLAGLTCLSFWSGTGEAADARWDDGVPRYTEAKVIIHEDGPNLLFSDSPEMVQKCGVMYRDTVKGKFRLFFHHVNDTDSSKRLAIVLRRTGIRPALVQLGRNGISDPNRDWLEAGKKAQIRYYGKQKETDPLRISRMTDLLGLQKPTIIRPQELVTGIVNLESDRPVEVSVMMIPVKTDLGLALDAYGILPPDEGDHVLRGTFPASDVHVRLQEAYPSNKLETWGIKLADDVLNPYVRGTDATTGKKVVNYGNYGVMYDVILPTKGKRDTVLRFNPYGGPYAGAGLLSMNGEEAKEIKIPGHGLAFGWSHDGETMVLGTIPENGEATLHFSPPGSSNLPIRLFLSPKS